MAKFNPRFKEKLYKAEPIYDYPFLSLVVELYLVITESTLSLPSPDAIRAKKG
jgi:hypothetical protein